MSEKRSDKSEESAVQFAARQLKARIAPPGSAAGVEARIRLASRRLGWSYTRTKDVWYAEDRVSIDADEMRQIEEKSGVRYGISKGDHEGGTAGELIAKAEAFIARAEALLEREDPDRHRPVVCAIRTLFGSLHRP